MHLYDDDDDRVLDMGQPMTARRKRLIEQSRARTRPAFERAARQQFGADAPQDAIDYWVEQSMAGGRVPVERLRALEAAAAADLPIAIYDRLLNEGFLRVQNELRFANLRTRLRLICMATELDELIARVPKHSATRRDAEALKAVLKQRIKDLAW